MNDKLSQTFNQFNSLLICFEENQNKTICISDKNYKYPNGDKITIHNCYDGPSSLSLSIKKNNQEEKVVAEMTHSQLSYIFSKNVGKNKPLNKSYSQDSLGSHNSNMNQGVYNNDEFQFPENNTNNSIYNSLHIINNNSHHLNNQLTELNGSYTTKETQNNIGNFSNLNSLTYSNNDYNFNCFYDEKNSCWTFTNKKNPDLTMIISNEHLSIGAKYLDKDNAIDSICYNPFEDNIYNSNKFNKLETNNMELIKSIHNEKSKINTLTEENNKLKKTNKLITDDFNNLKVKYQSMDQSNKTNSNLVAKLSDQLNVSTPNNQDVSFTKQIRELLDQKENSQIEFTKLRQKIDELEDINKKDEELLRRKDKELSDLDSKIKQKEELINQKNKQINDDLAFENNIINNALNGMKDYYEQAKLILTLRTKKYPKNPENYFYIGYLNLKEGQFDYAIITFKKVIDIKRDHDKAYLYLGVAYFNNGNYNDAKINIKIAIEIEQNNPNPFAFYQLGLISQSEEDLEETLCNLKKVLEHDPKFNKKEEILLKLAEINRKMKNFNEAISYLEGIIKEFPKGDMNKVYKILGEIYIDTENIENLCNEKILSELDNSKNEIIYYKLCVIFSKINRLTDAEKFILKAINLNKKNSEYYFLYGDILRRIGKKYVAESIFQEAIKLNPNEVRTIFALANLKLKQKQEPDQIFYPEELKQKYKDIIENQLLRIDNKG